jgi:dolichyl-phosphate beta-glucosyltransferase
LAASFRKEAVKSPLVAELQGLRGFHCSCNIRLFYFIRGEGQVEFTLQQETTGSSAFHGAGFLPCFPEGLPEVWVHSVKDGFLFMQSANSEVHLSVIIPAYNEEQRLPKTIRQASEYLQAQPYRSEILVVDDGSSDGTGTIVSTWPGGKVPVRLLRHADGMNHGKGASTRLGMLAARGTYRLFMDADNSTTLDHVSRFWPFFDQGYEVVIGSRGMPDSCIAVHQNRLKEFAGRMGNRAIQWLAVPGIRDTQAGFKMFTGRSAEIIFPRLTISRWGFDVEILVIAGVQGWKIREVPITWINAQGSKVSLGSYFQVLMEVWRIRKNAKAGLYA